MGVDVDEEALCSHRDSLCLPVASGRSWRRSARAGLSEGNEGRRDGPREAIDASAMVGAQCRDHVGALDRRRRAGASW